MMRRRTRPYKHQLDLFRDDRAATVTCPVCHGRKAVPFWSHQGRVPVIGGKQVACRRCGGSGRVAAA
jgi:DnaJ-class molecular chaperone